jgi:hypothetical protein
MLLAAYCCNLWASLLRVHSYKTFLLRGIPIRAGSFQKSDEQGVLSEFRPSGRMWGLPTNRTMMSLL